MRKGSIVIILILIIAVFLVAGVWLWKTHPALFKKSSSEPIAVTTTSIPIGLLDGSVKTIDENTITMVNGGALKQVNGTSTFVENTWTITVKNDTRIVRRFFADAKEFNKAYAAYMDAKARGDTSSTPPALYREEAYALGNIKSGDNLNILTSAPAMPPGAVPPDGIVEIIVFPTPHIALQSTSTASSATARVYSSRNESLYPKDPRYMGGTPTKP